jgi:stearoyl-CoA desaturase (delta-9 desaturase)
MEKMNQSSGLTDSKEGKPRWNAILVLIPTPILAAILVPWYGYTYGYAIFDWLWFGFFMLTTGIAITMGYHRLWSHKSFKANAFIRFLLMFFGSATLQNSIIQWCSDHRKHHRHVDKQDQDPYAATRGLFFSHIGWMLKYNTDEVEKIEGIDDLWEDRIVRFQYRYYGIIAIFSSFILPLLIGWTYGSAIGCFLLAGLLRLVINHHFTFFINSLAHKFGSRKFSLKYTARDNPFLSLVTYGEGYHNFHHAFAGDYRNGIQWYDFDPSKWLIATGEKFGWCWGVKRTPQYIIESARAKVELLNAQQRLASHNSIYQGWKEKIETHYDELIKSLSAWAKANQEWLKAQKSKVSKEQIDRLKKHYKCLKKEYMKARRNWQYQIFYMRFCLSK